MGLLFGKKKKGEDAGPIRKVTTTQPRGANSDTKRVRVAEEANSERSTSGSVVGRVSPGGTGSPGTGTPIDKRNSATDLSSNGFPPSKGTGDSPARTNNGRTGNSSGNLNVYNTSSGLGNGVNNGFSIINNGGNNGFNNGTGTNNVGATGTNNGARMTNGTSEQDMYRQSPLDRVVNLYGISLGIFNITRAVLSVQDWNDPLFIQLMEAAVVDLEKELRVVKDADKLRGWAQPLHYRKTGSVIGAARRVQQAHKYFMEWAIKLKQTGGVGFGPTEQRQFKDTLKEMVRTFVQLLSCCEMVVTADFNTEINELARTMRDVVDTASGKLNFVFDDVARICTTCSVRLSRLSLWKSLQVTNIPWSRSVNDTCYTVTKATKVLYIVGERLYRNMSDQTAYDNLTALTKGVVLQIKKLQGMVQTEPPEQKNVVITFTPEIIQEHTLAYDQGIKEVSNSLNVYVKKHNEDLTVVGTINKIISQLEAIKNTVRTPDNSALVVAVASISDSVEKFCGATYHALYHLGEENEVLKEQIMETMQHILHCIIQLQVVAVTKGLYFTIINPEATMLTCLRSLLLSVSIIIDAIDYMKADSLLEDNSGAVTLLPEEINEAIVYILHYGRPLYKGEGEEEGQETEDVTSVNMNVTTTATTTTTNTPMTSPIKTSPITNNNPSSSNDQYPDDNIDDDMNDNENDNQNDNDNQNGENNDNSDNGEDFVAESEISLVLPVAKKANPPATTATTTTTTTSTTTGTTSSTTNNAVSAGKLTPEEEELLSINPDEYSDTNVPPGFDPAPAKPVYVKGSTQEQYKAYMVAKYEYETWENKLILHKLKLNKQIDELKARKGLK